MKRYFFTMICFLIVLLSRGVPTGFLFRHYSVDNGLQSSTVRAILQDKYGFVWLGTDEGLNRYDGTTIKKYIFNHQSADQYVSCLFDAGNRIWIGSAQGITLYDYTTESYAPLHVKTRRGTRINTNITHITKDNDGNIWISTMEQGVFKYSIRMHTLDQYPMKKISGKVSHVMIDSDNQIWAISNWGTPAVWKLDKARNIFVPVNLKGSQADHYMSLCLFEDGANNLWLGTWEHGLMRIDKSGHTETCLAGAMHIHSITEYAPNQLLVGCDDGLFLYNTTTKLWQVYTEDDANPFSISNRFVYPVVKDREGGVWVGTFYGGVNYIAPNAGRF